MDKVEKEVPSAPIRRRAVNSVQQEKSVKDEKVNQGYHNPKLLTLMLLCLSCIGLICFYIGKHR